ncbi:MAG: GNAT family N-acetyltransferase [Rhodocyclaceae bacterium]
MTTQPDQTDDDVAPPFTTRDYRAQDAEALRALCREAIVETGASAYTEAQLLAWAAHACDDAQQFAERREQGWVRIAIDENGIVGFGQIDLPGHISMLFVAPHAGRQGVAGALLDDLVMLAEAMGARSVTVDASRIAQPFFLKHGFGEISTETVDIDGQQLTRCRMEARVGRR